MSRRLYGFLIRLHPACFRARHGAEMQDIFDESDPLLRCWLLRDAAGSVVRQWLLREHEEGVRAVREAGPQFAMVEEDRPDSSSLVHGGLVTIALWLAMASLLTYGVPRRLSPRGLIGSGRGNPQVVARHADGERTAPAAQSLFFGDPLFQSLDTDGNGVLPREEAMLSRSLLHTLDRDRDGVITAAECGVRLPRLQRWLGGSVFQIIDRNGDGLIEAAEKWAAPHLLLAADANGDGSITPEEIERYRR